MPKRARRAAPRPATGHRSPPRLTADSSAVTDPVTGETTITVSFDKEWSDEGTSGEEHGKTSETQDEAGNLTSAEGEAEGRETTVKGSADGGTAEIKTDNGSGKTVDGTPDIKTEVPDLTVELTPGGSAESSEAADAWLDEGTIDIPGWVKADDTWISEDSTSEDNGVITKVQVSIDAQTNTTTYTRTVYGTDGQQTTETVAYTRDKEGRITGLQHSENHDDVRDDGGFRASGKRGDKPQWRLDQPRLRAARKAYPGK